MVLSTFPSAHTHAELGTTISYLVLVSLFLMTVVSLSSIAHW